MRKSILIAILLSGALIAPAHADDDTLALGLRMMAGTSPSAAQNISAALQGRVGGEDESDRIEREVREQRERSENMEMEMRQQQQELETQQQDIINQRNQSR